MIKFKLILSVLKGNAIVISEEENTTRVYVGVNNDTAKVKRVASDFFKQAYKLV